MASVRVTRGQLLAEIPPAGLGYALSSAYTRAPKEGIRVLDSLGNAMRNPHYTQYTLQ